MSRPRSSGHFSIVRHKRIRKINTSTYKLAPNHRDFKNFIRFVCINRSLEAFVLRGLL